MKIYHSTLFCFFFFFIIFILAIYSYSAAQHDKKNKSEEELRTRRKRVYKIYSWMCHDEKLFLSFRIFRWMREKERAGGVFCEGQMRKNVLPQISASDFYRVPALKSLRLFRSQNKTEGNQHEDIWDLRFFDIKFKHKFAQWHLFCMCSKKLCKDFFLFYYCKCILNCWLSQKLNKFFINWNFLLKNQFFKEFLSDNLIY